MAPHSSTSERKKLEPRHAELKCELVADSDVFREPRQTLEKVEEEKINVVVDDDSDDDDNFSYNDGDDSIIIKQNTQVRRWCCLIEIL